jgi:hypothetical protein
MDAAKTFAVGESFSKNKVVKRKLFGPKITFIDEL